MAKRGDDQKGALPSAVHGTGPWGVSNAPTARVVVGYGGGGSFTAPMGDDEASEALRFQQYANLQLRHSQEAAVAEYARLCREAHVERDIVEAVFMAAVNGFAAARGVELKALPVVADASHGVEYLAKTYIGSFGASLANNLPPWVQRASKEINIAAAKAAQGAQAIGAKAATGAAAGQFDAVQLAHWAEVVQDAFDLKRAVDEGAIMPRSGAGDVPEGKRKENSRDMMNWLNSMRHLSSEWKRDFMRSLAWTKDMETAGEQLERLKSESERQSGMDIPPWGQMRKRALSMTKRAIRHSFRHRPCFIGAFRYPHRALIPAMDGRAWHAKLPGLGGTVLLDKSGSMSISEAQLVELLRRSPLATIAVYSGGGEHDSRGLSMGHLTVLAKEGRYAAERSWPTFPGANVVDGPALRWLARQARPRVWISDGEVTGASMGGEQNHPTLNLECLLICKMVGITQYHNIDAYLKSTHYAAQFK